MAIQEFFDDLPEERKAPMTALWEVIKANAPTGFAEQVCYSMPSLVVPHTLYPDGYQSNPKLPLVFTCIGSQKNFIVMHHMGLYADQDLLDWFVAEYPKHSKFKLDMGKGCVRFKKPDHIPYKLIGELAAKVSPQQYIAVYERSIKR